MSKLLRNWEEIAKVACEETKHALVMLTRLLEEHPECFRQGEDYELDQLSWRYILHAASKYHARNNDGELLSPQERIWDWHYCIQDATLDPSDRALAGIPFYAWGTGLYRNCLGPRPPQSIVDQLVQLNGKAHYGPIFLQYEGQRCIVGCIWYEYEDCQFEDGRFYHDPKKDGPHELALVPADVIAFDC